MLTNQDMVKIRNNISYIPIHTTEIKENLESYKETLVYKSNFINKYLYNTSLSPEANERKIQVNYRAKNWQDNLTAIYKNKLKKKAGSMFEKVKEEGEVESSVFDSILLRSTIQKMKIDELTRRIALETYRAKVQNFNLEKLKKKAEKEIVMKKFTDTNKIDVWNTVKLHRKPTIEPRVPKLELSNTVDFDFVTELPENLIKDE